jgi:hypothetical protein
MAARLRASGHRPRAAVHATMLCERTSRCCAGYTRVSRVRAWAITCALRHPRASANIGCAVVAGGAVAVR